ncbi:MAG TPA: hypothetical protein VF314_01010 [Actinomycetes bacterium]
MLLQGRLLDGLMGLRTGLGMGRRTSLGMGLRMRLRMGLRLLRRGGAGPAADRDGRTRAQPTGQVDVGQRVRLRLAVPPAAHDAPRR